ncbi:MAG: 2-hydroxyacid dehydrogenase [Verrucomicrobiota bacterium]
MRVAIFDTHQFDRESLVRANSTSGHDLVFLEVRLNLSTYTLAAGCQAVCVFVNDTVDAGVLRALAQLGVRLVALRCAGFNNVDLAAAQQCGIAVVRVPEYSPHAIAEHAVALLLALDRKLIRATARVRDGNFSLDGLVGFDLFGKTVGVLGTGKIGATFARIMRGFGCRVLGWDLHHNPELERDHVLVYQSLNEVLESSDILSLHIPLNSDTRHIVGAEAISRMKPGVVLINTGRGALIDTPALVEALKSGKVGAAGLDVYEEEEGVFFVDHSGEVLADEQLAWLLMCPNVLVTSHQAFLTKEALEKISSTTLDSITSIESQISGLAEKSIADQRVLLVGLG